MRFSTSYYSTGKFLNLSLFVILNYLLKEEFIPVIILQEQLPGRWSSSESIILPYGSGNLQQIPLRGNGSVIRSMYVVENQENWIIQADFVQAEAVIVAYLIGDTVLKEAFRLKKRYS